jgi:hypothetical protein
MFLFFLSFFVCDIFYLIFWLLWLLHMLGVYYCWILTHICYINYKICVILTSYLLLYRSAILNIILLIECLQHILFHLIDTLIFIFKMIVSFIFFLIFLICKLYKLV